MKMTSKLLLPLAALGLLLSGCGSGGGETSQSASQQSSSQASSEASQEQSEELSSEAQSSEASQEASSEQSEELSSEELSSEASEEVSSEQESSEDSSSETPTEIDVDPFDRTYEKFASEGAYVRKVENLTDSNFIMGMDASSVIAEENSGVVYHDFNGEEADVFKVLSDSGINYIRVRIWNDPFDAEGHGYGGGNNDLATAIKIGKRATANNMALLVDFHYSDFWADPSKQMAPKAWADMWADEKADALYNFTKDSLQALKDEGIVVGMVQVGNETNGGKIAGESTWRDFVSLAGAGSRAIREIYPDALVAVHFANPEKTSNYLNWADRIKDLDYDVFGSSYYPYWHGTLDNLSNVLSTIAETYNKYTMVMETSYAWTGVDTDGWSNTIGETSGYDVRSYPFTMHGQINSVVDIIDTIKNKTTNGIGVCYWEGTWITVGDTTHGATWEANHLKWEEYGSGWATSYAGEYDPKDAGQYYGGCAVDNQAFFDAAGYPLESLKLWNLVRFGNEIEKFIDGVEDVNVVHYDSETFTLPETVNVVYCDNSKSPIEVTWSWGEEEIEAAKAAGNGRHVIEGVAGGKTVYCTLTILEFNYISNYSFEDGLDPWEVTVDKGEATYIKITNENPRTGKSVFHFWDSLNTGVKFHVEQAIEPTAGVYKMQASHLCGGKDNENLPTATQNNSIYVKINDEVKFSSSFLGTKWADGFQDVLLDGIVVEEGDKVVVGFEIDIGTAGCWGGIDDVMFNRSKLA